MQAAPGSICTPFSGRKAANCKCYYTWNVSTSLTTCSGQGDCGGHFRKFQPRTFLCGIYDRPLRPGGADRRYAATTSGKVTVTWAQNSEVDLHYYNINRSETGAGFGYSLLKASLSTLGYIDMAVQQGIPTITSNRGGYGRQ